MENLLAQDIHRFNTLNKDSKNKTYDNNNNDDDDDGFNQ